MVKVKAYVGDTEMVFTCDCGDSDMHGYYHDGQILECPKCGAKYRIHFVGYTAERLAKLKEVKPGLYKIEDENEKKK